jgi:osmoprotectant transport system ATP-binding protein
VIEFKSVSKLYPDGTHAVDNFSVVIPSRKTTVFVGSSGCGKTTLLRMINRMVDPTAGVIEIDSEDIAKTEPVHLRRRIGYVMQNSGLLPHRTVLDNVATVLFLTKVPKTEAYARANELLDTVGLDRSLAKRYPGELSGGQQQRVGVARGLAANPNILLMDEPFGAVDPIVRVDLQAETIRLQRELDKTIVFVTHDIDEAFLLGDQVIILEKGAQIAQQGSPEEILANPASDFVASFVGADRGKRRLTVDAKVTSRGDEVPQHFEQDLPGGRRVMQWVWDNFSEIWGYTLDHIGLSVPPIVIGFVLSIPLGYWASRSRVARSILLSVFSILYTLPALVLFVTVPVALGLAILNPNNVIVALTIYAMAIMIRSANDAFGSVSADVRESARAVGYSAVQRFFRVELPLAGPVLLAGIRVVSVSTVSLATVGGFIGIPSLGNLFQNGFQIHFFPELWAGIVAVLVVAAVFDLILSALGRILMPWNRGRTRRRASRMVAKQVIA